jgi:rubrerythrin
MNSLFQKNNPKRHKLIADAGPQLLENKSTYNGIKTLKSLQEHLQTAIEIEHSTIPPYLCALYSIKDGTNQRSAAVIRSVVVEEMLHMIMAANILNAIGGEPKINSEKFIPHYPTSLPHSNASFIVNLQKFSKATLETFLHIELPSTSAAPAQGQHYNTIGQFYKAVMEGIEYVNKNTEGGIFKGEKSRQITAEQYYGSGGKLVAVYSIEDARTAIEEIVGQGEGIDGTINDPDHQLFDEENEYAHYFKFNEIYREQLYRKGDSAQEPPTGHKLEVDWDGVHNMKLNPKLSDYKTGSELWNKTNEFNITYMTLLDNIHKACNGQPELLMKGIALMYDLKYKALELMNTPAGAGGFMAGPTFEYVKI